jgi:hypothetical protein
VIAVGGVVVLDDGTASGGGGSGGEAGSLSNAAQGELLSLVFGTPVALRDPCVQLVEINGLADNPFGEALTYDAGVLTFGVVGDFNELIEADFELGDRLFWHFSAQDRAFSGPYAFTSLGSASTAATWARAEDFDASGDIVRGITFPVGSDGGATVLLRLTTSPPYVLDTTDLTFAQLTAAVAT